MKKIIYLLVLLSSSLLFSCEKDEPTLKSENIETGYDTFRYELDIPSKTVLYYTDSLGHFQDTMIYEPQTWVYEWSVEKPYYAVYCSFKGQIQGEFETTPAEARLYINGELIDAEIKGGFTQYLSKGGLTSPEN